MWVCSDLIDAFRPNTQVATADVTIPDHEFQLAHDRASFVGGQKVQKMLESGGPRVKFLVCTMLLVALVTTSEVHRTFYCDRLAQDFPKHP